MKKLIQLMGKVSEPVLRLVTGLALIVFIVWMVLHSFGVVPQTLPALLRQTFAK